MAEPLVADPWRQKMAKPTLAIQPLQRRTARSATALGMLLAASGVLHPLQPQAAQQKYLWNVTVGDSFKTFEVMVHPDWCVLHTH